MTKEQLLAVAEKYHKECPGAWLKTDRAVTSKLPYRNWRPVYSSWR